ATQAPGAALQQRSLRAAARRLDPHAQVIVGNRHLCSPALRQHDHHRGDGRKLFGCHSGELPCLRAGSCSRFVRSIASARASILRVSRGSMTSSTYPRSAAWYGLRNRSSYSTINSARRASGSEAASISLRKMMLTAPSAPITAISADGHANAMSAPIDFEFMTTYAPP